MSFNHSLKLLNKASLDGSNYLQLYTELDNNFVVGDQLVISGGYYDNTDLSSFSTYDPYASKSYVIRAVDPSTNSFTINYKVTGTTYFPYAAKTATTNNFGNPQNSSDIGYNHFSGTMSLYKNVYVSVAQLVRGKFKKGLVQNGILGTDKTSLLMNDTLYNNLSRAKLTITHAAFKNVTVPACTISNKSFGSTQPTIKFKVTENTSTSFPLVPVIIGSANDGYGYSSFEKCLLGDQINPANYYVDINNNWLANQNATSAFGGSLQFFSCNFNSCRVGSDVPMTVAAGGSYGANDVKTSIFNSCDVRNVFTSAANLLTFSGGNLSNGYSITVTTTSITYGSAGHVILTVDYDSIANCYFDSAEPLMVMGILKASDNTPAREFLTECFIVSATYTYGTPSSGGQTIDLRFPGLVSGWASILSAYPNPQTNLVWSGIKIYQGTTSGNRTTIQKALMSNLTEIQSYLTASDIPAADIVIMGSGSSTPTNVKNSFLNNVILDGSVSINASGTSYSEFSYLKDCRQFTDYGESTYDWKWSIIDVTGNTRIFEGNFLNTIHVGGHYSNSSFRDASVTSNSTQNVFLYDCLVSDRSFIDDTPYTFWERCTFDPIIDTWIGTTLILGGRFKGRKTKFTTGDSNIAGIGPGGKVSLTSKVFEVNNKKVIGTASSVPTSADISFQQGGTVNSYYATRFVPTDVGLLAPSSTSVMYAFYDLGDKNFLGSWSPANNRNDLLIADDLTNSVLYSTLNNVQTNTTSGTYDPNFTNPPVIVAAGPGLDNNFVYEYDGYKKKNKQQSNLYQMTSVFELEPVPSIPPGFPQRSGNDPNVSISMNLQPLPSGAPIPIAAYSTPTGGTGAVVGGIAPGSYSVNFTNFAWQSGMGMPATTVPNSYIEIEGFTLKQETNLGVLVSAKYIAVNESFTNDYRDDQSMPYSSVPASSTYLSISLASSSRISIEVDFYVTCYVSSAYPNCGMKVRQSYVWMFENP